MNGLVDWVNAHGFAMLLGFAFAWFIQTFRVQQASREAYALGRQKMAEELERTKDFLVPGQPCAECGVVEGPCAHYELNPYDEAVSPVLDAVATGRKAVPARELAKWAAQAGAAIVRPRRFRHKGPGGRYRIGAWENGGPNDEWTGRDLSDVEWCREPAEKGDADAQVHLGYAYFNGEGVAKDPELAVRWFRKAAEQGDVRAQFLLAGAYYHGEGVTKDLVEAARWCRRAAEQGHTEAQRNLGRQYYHGEGVPRDLVESVRWYRKAAEQGDANAQCNLGNAYDRGEGVSKDSEEAVRWYRRAAEQGDANAQVLLGLAYNTGEGVARDIPESVRWFQRAAEQGNENALRALETITTQTQADPP